MKYFPPLLDKEDEKCKNFVNMVSCNYSVFSESRQARICIIIVGIERMFLGSVKHSCVTGCSKDEGGGGAMLISHFVGNS